MSVIIILLLLLLLLELGRNPVSKHQIQPEYEDEQADAGRDGWIRLARPNSQARTGTGEYYFLCSADHEQDWQPYRVDPYSAICDDHTYIHTYILVYYIKVEGAERMLLLHYCYYTIIITGVLFWLSACHDLRLGMDGMLLAPCDHTGSRDRANVPLIIIIIII